MSEPETETTEEQTGITLKPPTVLEEKQKQIGPRISVVTSVYFQPDGETQPVEVSSTTEIVLPTPDEELEQVWKRELKIKPLETKPIELGWLEDKKVSAIVLTTNHKNKSIVRVLDHTEPIFYLPPGISLPVFRNNYSGLTFESSETCSVELVAFPGVG